MKKYIFLLLITGMIACHYSCTDVQGDGIDTIVYTGSEVPEDTAYWNPVWNFDLTDASVFLSSGPYYGMGTEKAWAEGIQYVVPTLSSTNLMDWSLITQAQAFMTKPGWTEGNVNSVTGVFSKSFGMYYVFYKLGNDAMGAADAKTPQGPYRDYGKFTDKEALGASSIVDPFVYASGTNFYLFYGVTDDGIYGVKLTVVKNALPTVSGTPFKIAGPGLSGIFIRKKGTRYFLTATRDNEIIMAQASVIEGPFTDQGGTDMTQGGGTTLVTLGSDFQKMGQCAGIQTDKKGNDWILYTAVTSEIPTLPTGEDRFVLMLNRISYDAGNWPTAAIEAKSGYTYPRFQ
jgi:arabinan endo-1,5-alpha-L-arabinosidase